MNGNANDWVKFYPNPASSFINFEYQKPFDRNYSLQIFNFMGKKVVDIRHTPSKMNLALEQFYRGIYIFQLRDASGKILQSGKFQVVK